MTLCKECKDSLAQIKMHIHINIQYELSIYICNMKPRMRKVNIFITFITETTSMEPITQLLLLPYWNDLASEVNHIFCKFSIFKIND